MKSLQYLIHGITVPPLHEIINNIYRLLANANYSKGFMRFDTVINETDTYSSTSTMRPFQGRSKLSLEVSSAANPTATSRFL